MSDLSYPLSVSGTESLDSDLDFPIEPTAAASTPVVTKDFGSQAHGGGLAVAGVFYNTLPGPPGAGVVLSQLSAPTGDPLFVMVTALPHTLLGDGFPFFDTFFQVSFNPGPASPGASSATFHLALDGVPFDLHCTVVVT